MKKALSVIEIQILMVLIVIGLFGFNFLLNFLSENMWIVYTVIVSIIVLFIIIYLQSQEEKKCNKCFSKNTKVVNTEDKIVGWKYETKQGYPDKRRKNNFAKHLLLKNFKCNDCGHEFKLESCYEK